MLKAGDRAPDFSALASNGERVSLSSLRGRVAVIYFFPKAFTPGCTRETKRFRDNYDELRALGAEVIGVSVDDPQTQCEFAQRHAVRFPLIGDSDQAISKAFGVLRGLLPFDKRATFVIDESGTVAAVFHHEFQVLRHLDDVLGFLEKRAGSRPVPMSG